MKRKEASHRARRDKKIIFLELLCSLSRIKPRPCRNSPSLSVPEQSQAEKRPHSVHFPCRVLLFSTFIDS